MMRHLATIASVTVALLSAAGQAHADSRTGLYQCAPNADGSVLLTCMPAAPGTATTAPAAPPADASAAAEPTPAQAPARSLDGRTHAFLAPTGELVPAGDVELQVHEFGIYNTLAIGVSDHVELSFGAPIIPVVGSVSARVQVMPRSSRLRLAVGGAVMMPLFEDADEFIYQGTLTAAYHTGRANLHATVSVLGVTGEDDKVGLANIGVAYQVSPKIALLADWASVSLTQENDYYYADCAPTYEGGGCVSESPSEVESKSLPMLGLKVLGEHFDTDAGLLFFLDSDGVIALPLLSMTYRY